MALLGLIAVWSFAEATLFFIVADVPIMAVGIRYGRRRAFAAALVAALAGALGGLATMQWAALAPDASRAAIERLPGVGAALFDRTAAAWQEGGAGAMLRGSFGGVPYKLFAHAAGVDGAGVFGFFVASVAARLPRFLLVALAAGLVGPPLRRRLSPALLWTTFALCWTAFYGWYFAAMAAA